MKILFEKYVLIAFVCNLSAFFLIFESFPFFGNVFKFLRLGLQKKSPYVSVVLDRFWPYVAQGIFSSDKRGEDPLPPFEKNCDLAIA